LGSLYLWAEASTSAQFLILETSCSKERNSKTDGQNNLSIMKADLPKSASMHSKIQSQENGGINRFPNVNRFLPRSTGFSRDKPLAAAKTLIGVGFINRNMHLSFLMNTLSAAE
jgi:hypothetical protein